MRLLQLKLNNFQGISSLTLDFNGKSSSIYGDNATGKTTVFNAHTWWLFDKASTGAKNFTPKTKGADGDLHGLEHSAEAVCQLENGSVVSFKKVFKEIYKQTRGSATKEFSGHTTDYFIDGVDSKQKEFDEAINSYFGEPEQLKMLTMPHYFPEEMTWEARRKILLAVCGDITDEDVISSTKELQELRTYLLKPGTADQYYTVDDYKKIAGSKMSEINKRIQTIPSRVDEAQRAVPDTSGLSLSRINTRIKELQEKKEELEREKLQILSGDTAGSEVRKQIAEIKVQLSEARAKYLENSSKVNEKVHEEIVSCKNILHFQNDKLCNIDNDLFSKERELKRLMDKRDLLLQDYKAASSTKWDDAKSICPTCKRDLPEEDIEKMKEEFNLTRSKKLEEINLRGKEEASKETIAEVQALIATLKESSSKIASYVKELSQQLEELKSQIVEAQPFEDTDTYKQIAASIKDLQDQEHKGYTDNQMLAAGVTKNILQVQEDIRAQEELRAKFAMADVQAKRIEELMKEETDLAKEYEKLQKGVYLCETFTRTKVSMLDNKINSKFKNVRFRLFQEQINGGLKEDCEVMIPTDTGRLVPFSFANNAGRINAGLEIIDTLGKHWGISMPVFVDNAESVTRLMETDTQLIRLVVPAPYESIVPKPTPDTYDYLSLLTKWEVLKTEYEERNKKLRLEVNSD